MNFHLASYRNHQQSKHDAKHVATWRNEKTVDYWRHQRMYRQIDPLLISYPKAKWLTVGDGRYGTDAHYINQFGVDVIASDINDSCLKQAKQDGFIRDYAVENAEHLSFKDEEFDFVLCKESYHHFPRPMLAVYEMLRVAGKGIILIEPNDQAILEPYKDGVHSLAYWFEFTMKQSLKKVIGKKSAEFPNRYESSGNYVYSISRREMEKVALGLNLDTIATKGLNDSYLEGVEYEEVGENGPLFRKVKQNIKRMDEISKRRPEAVGLLIAILFKGLPDQKCLELLRQNEFAVTALEKNPYINS